MGNEKVYQDWCAHVSLSPSLTRFLHALPVLSLSQRKTLLTACRCQSYPHDGSRLYTRLKREWDDVVNIDHLHQPVTERTTSRRPITVSLRTFVKPCTQFLESSITSGFLSAAIRSAPIEDIQPFEESRTELLAKEILASTRPYRPTKFDYSVIFSTSPLHRQSSFASNLDPAPLVAAEIHSSFLRVKASLDNSVLFPKISKKKVGRLVSDEFWKVVPQGFVPEIYDEFEECGGVTTQILQKLEFWRGYRVGGPVEVRSSWKYSDLKPRIYFAQGGDTFHISKYVQRVFNDLADALDITHTKNRSLPLETGLTKEDTLIIYDYSSFTSTIDEIRAFLEELANFFRGATVYLVGHRDGPQPMDLGEMIAEYNRTCNFDALFDVSRVASFEGPPLLLRHTCGMLGVPGDIQSKTILHGIHTAFITGSTKKSRCIGDDAKIMKVLETPADRLVLEHQLRNIGRISIEKFEEFPYTEEDDYELDVWHYAKRPITRFGNRIIQHYMVVFPTFDCLLGLSDSCRSVVPGQLGLHNRRTTFSNIWLRLLVTLSIYEEHISEEDAQFLYQYQREAFFRLGINGRRAGRYEEDGHYFNVPPFLAKEEFGMDPLKLVTRDFLWDEEVEALIPGGYIQWPVGYLGEVFESGLNKELNFLVKMGILEKKWLTEKISRSLVGDDNFARRYLGYKIQPLYEFTVVREIPKWYYSLMS